jgi:hypothetical protein
LTDWETFFRLYNERLAEAFDAAMEQQQDESHLGDPEVQTALRHSVLNSMQAWYGIPFEELGGRTPEEALGTIDGLDEALRVFRLAAVLCDEDIPEYLKIRLGSFGMAAVDRLLAIAQEPAWEVRGDDEEAPDEALMASAMALRLLGEWEMVQTLETVTDRFLAAGHPGAFVADAYKSYVVGIGPPACPLLIHRLDDSCSGKVAFSMSHEYTMIALSVIGQDGRSDAIFACLRRCFRAMDHKVIGAVCLGDYGDPRGITVLKSYLDDPRQAPDRQLFYEILSSIRRLGGEIHDIRDPFGDFSLKK